MVGFGDVVGWRDDVGEELGLGELVGLYVGGGTVGGQVHGGYVGHDPLPSVVEETIPSSVGRRLVASLSSGGDATAGECVPNDIGE